MAEVVLKNIKEIRQGERQYFEKRDKYGTLEDLAGLQLISDDLSDGVDRGYRFSLVVQGNRYMLNADPVNSGDPNLNRLFMDETGLIRASNDPLRPADKDDDIIGNQ